MIVCRGCHYWQKKIPHFEGMRSEPLQNGQTQPQDASGCLRYRSLPGVGGRGRSPLIFWISNPHASLFWQPNRSELPAILKSLKDWMRMAERRCLAEWLSCLRLHLISLITPALSYCFPFEVPLGVFPLPSGGMPHFQTYPKPPQNVGKTMCCPILLPFSSIFPHVLWGHSSSFEGPKATCWQRCFFVSARRPTPGGDFTGGWSCSRG